MQLTVLLGYGSIRECQDGVDSAEFTEWKVGIDKHVVDEAAERRAAWIAYCAYCSNPYAQARSLAEFLPEALRHTPPEMPEEEMKRQFRKAKARWPGRKKRRQKRHRTIG